jgi:hypothetical protein
MFQQVNGFAVGPRWAAARQAIISSIQGDYLDFWRAPMPAGEMDVLKTWVRLALIAIVVVMSVGISSVTPVSAWVESSVTGQIGERKMVDSSSLAGVVCHNDLTSFPGSVAIEARNVYLKPVAGYPTQTMSVQYLLYQELPNGSLDLISRSPLVKKQAGLSVWENFDPYTFADRALGPRYIVFAEMVWYDVQGTQSGRVRARMSYYETRSFLPEGNESVRMKTACVPPTQTPPTAGIGATRGTVNSSISYSLRYYPADLAVPVSWDGKTIGTVLTTATGIATGTFAVPAAPMGTHQMQWTAGTWRSSATFTVVPRIKLIPETVSRGRTVNVSLRGYAAREVVRIRWKKGLSWVQLATMTTSSTGSANIDIKVPSWAPDGAASVRGDGTYGRAQTNAVLVSGGSMSASGVKTPTATATATNVPATSTATPSPQPTVTSTSTATIEATIAAPSETPTPLATIPVDASPVPAET